MESLYLVSKEDNKAWEGTLVDIGGRVGIRTSDNELIELDSVLPRGETGKFLLIWDQNDDAQDKREI